MREADENRGKQKALFHCRERGAEQIPRENKGAAERRERFPRKTPGETRFTD